MMMRRTVEGRLGRVVAAHPGAPSAQRPILLVAGRRQPWLAANRGLSAPASSAAAAQEKWPNFQRAGTAYDHSSTAELVRAFVVFRLCSLPWLVRSSGWMLAAAYGMLPSALVDKLLELSFFGHFCGGRGREDIAPTVERLRAAGVGSILDYAAEADVEGGGGAAAAAPAAGAGSAGGSGDTSSLARVYDYSSEAACDANADIFMDCIQAVHDVTPEGFAAVKITALGNPLLLERMSTALREIQQLFARFEASAGVPGGGLTVDKFRAAWATFFVDSDDEHARRVFERWDEDRDGLVDIVEWSNQLTLTELTGLVSRCVDKGPLYRAALTPGEQELMNHMVARVEKVVGFAAAQGVRVMIDAEQSYFQPAIDLMVLQMQRKFNRPGSGGPTVFNTYQCYLADAERRVINDMDRARREGFAFAAKVVRGAYMVGERERAAALGQPSPVHETLADTHACYNRVLCLVLDEMGEEGGAQSVGGRPELMIATHNQHSVEFALAEMRRRGIDRRAGGVFFGQLLGMADHLTFSLGVTGFNAYKYVPYGPVRETVPYLVRRAQENADMLKGAEVELPVLRSEILARLRGA